MNKFVRCKREETGTMFVVNLNYVSRAYERNDKTWVIEDMNGRRYMCVNQDGEESTIDESIFSFVR